MLIGLNQKVSGQVQWVIQSPAVDVAPPAKRQNLTSSGTHVERGLSRNLPFGESDSQEKPIGLRV